MPLQIDRLNLSLPASLGHRKHAISRLLRSELQRFDWPGPLNITQLGLPALELSSRQSNLAIAGAIARQIHRSALQQASDITGGTA
jgi:hypothetical protein